MKCTRCGHVSFDHAEACKKCGTDLVQTRACLGFSCLRPCPPCCVVQAKAPGAPTAEPETQAICFDDSLDSFFDLNDTETGTQELGISDSAATFADPNEEAASRPGQKTENQANLILPEDALNKLFLDMDADDAQLVIIEEDTPALDAGKK